MFEIKFVIVGFVLIGGELGKLVMFIILDVVWIVIFIVRLFCLGLERL